MPTIPFERVFCLGSFDALLVLRRFRRDRGDATLLSLAGRLSTLSADYEGLDFEAAISLHDFVDETTALNAPAHFFRACILGALAAHRTDWARTIGLGRERFVRQLSRNEQQCFRAALLLTAPPGDDVVDWWDGLGALLKHESDQAVRRRSRAAERLSLEHERNRLRRIGIEHAPVWVAIDDNTAGYDVLSYEPTTTGTRSRYIEVKSTIASPLRFIVTKNEWRVAVANRDSYVFHVWDLAQSTPVLYERSVGEVEPSIPSNRQDGTWLQTEVRLGARH